MVLSENSVDVNELFIMQKQCVRTLSHIDNTENCKSLYNLNLLTLQCVYILNICMFVLKNLNIFPKAEDIHNLNTRDYADYI